MHQLAQLAQLWGFTQAPPTHAPRLFRHLSLSSVTAFMACELCLAGLANRRQPHLMSDLTFPKASIVDRRTDRHAASFRPLQSVLSGCTTHHTSTRPSR